MNVEQRFDRTTLQYRDVFLSHNLLPIFSSLPNGLCLGFQEGVNNRDEMFVTGMFLGQQLIET